MSLQELARLFSLLFGPALHEKNAVVQSKCLLPSQLSAVDWDAVVHAPGCG